MMLEGGAGPCTEGNEGVERMDPCADGMECVVSPNRPETPSHTPVRWATPNPVPVTPTKGSKRTAVGTPRPPQTPPAGCAADARRLCRGLGTGADLGHPCGTGEEDGGGLTAVAADANDREERMTARWLANAEEREERLAVKLLATEGIASEMTQKANWDIKQWTDLAGVTEDRRKETSEVKWAVDGIAVGMAGLREVRLLPATVATPNDLATQENLVSLARFGACRA